MHRDGRFQAGKICCARDISWNQVKEQTHEQMNRIINIGQKIFLNTQRAHRQLNV